MDENRVPVKKNTSANRERVCGQKVPQTLVGVLASIDARFSLINSDKTKFIPMPQGVYPHPLSETFYA